MKQQNSNSLSVFVAAMAWVSTFSLSWKLLDKAVQLDWLSVLLFVFFLLVSIFASVTATSNKNN